MVFSTIEAKYKAFINATREMTFQGIQG